MKVILRQRAVGQGGFCVGEIRADVESLRWVYDCGSNQMDSLRREIRHLDGADIDILFLSHLDNDHVNGIELLLSASSPREVVLPYLEEGERLIVLGEAEAEGTLTGSFRDFMTDPVGWFRSRGVNQVTFVKGSAEAGGESPREPTEAPSDVEGPFKAVWQPDVQSITSGWGKGGRSAEPGAAILVEGRTAAVVADWFFLPQVHRPSARRVSAFRAELATRFAGLRKAAITRAALDPANRRLLREAYHALWTDHNKVTMTLYAGPHPMPKPSHWTRRFRWPGNPNFSFWHPSCAFREHGISHVGWLSGGDADLSGPRRREQFLRFYGAVLERVGVFVLPHHGSALSFDSRMLDLLPDGVVGVAAAGPNGFGHPHQLVREAMLAKGAFVQVDDKASTTFTMELHDPH